MNERSIFLAALEKDPTDRGAFLAEACRLDAALRDQVEGLLRAYEKAAGFLEDAGLESATVDLPAKAQEERRIGPYKPLQQIGEGGMGTVWMAEQSEPVRRIVALKIIKPGMDSSQVVARFEAERQALAMMDHPNIAKVLDAGTTESGRPYFVMELVKGIPITQYCDEQRLAPRERLELMIPVCQAIQHAHQKGIIHRDIKPSNVLIASYDGHPVPKVIDFGVAKAMGQKLTERTLFTGFGGLIGTLEYMSPEQAEFNALDVDTRSDIYSLGVLLYELLTGTTPLTKERLKDAAISELLRTIREEEPPRPSTRLSQSSDSLPSISAQRRTEPDRLPRLVRGDLDWIVMKALEKDRSRRYETATHLMRDIERYLVDDTVDACPPSIKYRLQKFLRRNRIAVWTAVVVFASLVTCTVLTSWQAFRAIHAERSASLQLQRAIQAQTTAEKARAGEESAKRTAVAMAAGEAQAKRDAVSALQKAQTEQAIAKEMNELIFRMFLDARPTSNGDRQLTLKSLLDDASNRFETQQKTHPLAEASVREILALGYQLCGDYEKAQLLWEQVYRIRAQQIGDEDPETQRVLRSLAHAYHWDGKFDQARPLYEKLLDLSKRTESWDYPGLLYELAFLYHNEMEYAAAESLWVKFLEGGGYSKPGANSMVTSLMTAQAKQQLAQCYRDQERFDLAEPLFTEAIDGIRGIAGEGGLCFILAELGRMRIQQGRFTDAEPVLRKSLDTFDFAPKVDWRRFDAQSLLGASLLGQQKYADAEALLIQGFEGMKHSQEKRAALATVTKEAKHRMVEAGERLVQLYEAWDKPDELAKWREQIK